MILSGNLRTLPKLITDLPSGGSVGAAAMTIDVYAQLRIAQSTAGQTITIPSPTLATDGYVVGILNTGSVSFIVAGVVLLPNLGVVIQWNGTTWALAIGSSTSPAGVSAEMQYRGAGNVFAAATGFEWSPAGSVTLSLVSNGIVKTPFEIREQGVTSNNLVGGAPVLFMLNNNSGFHFWEMGYRTMGAPHSWASYVGSDGALKFNAFTEPGGVYAGVSGFGPASNGEFIASPRGTYFYETFLNYYGMLYEKTGGDRFAIGLSPGIDFNAGLDRVRWGIDGVAHHVPSTAMADIKVENNEVHMYFDEAGNKLKFKVKYAGGTVKSGEIALV